MADTEQLVVALEARVKEFERNFQRANRTANDNFGNIERRAKQSADKLEKTFGDIKLGKFEGMLEPLLRGGIAGAGLTAAMHTLKEVASTTAEVGREARKAGVSAQTWQKWAYVATATGANIDGVTDALKELNIRGDEFAKTGKGSAEEAFQRLGYSATDVAQKLKDPSAFIDEIIGKLQKMDAAAQTRILDEVFGGQGAEEMAKVLGLSVDKVRELRNEAATFTDEQIEAAKKIDAAFATLWRNVSVYAKGAVLGTVGYAQEIIDYVNDPSGGAKAKVIAEYNSPEQQLKRLQAQRDDLAKQITDVGNSKNNVFKEDQLRRLRTELSDVDEKIHDLTGGSEEFKRVLKDLGQTYLSNVSGLEANANAARNFKAALDDLKQLVPGLKAEMDALATSTDIDAKYLKTVQNARTMGEVMRATDVSNQAHAAARVDFANKDTNKFLEGHLALGKDNSSVEGMSSAFSKKLATMLASMPDDLRGQITINSGYRSPQRQQELWLQALQKYGTVEEARKWVAPPGNSQHNKGNAADLGYGSDAAKQWAHQNAGDFGLSFPLNNENWHIEDEDARRSADNTAMEQKIDLAKKQADARKDLNRTVQEGLDLAQFEKSISGMTTQQQQIELEVFKTQQDAKRNGIALSDQELAKIREKITLTSQLNTQNKHTAASAEGLQNAQQFFASNFTSALSGLITGTTTLESAVKQLANSLINAALQAAFLGQGPLAGLGGGNSGGTGKLGGLFGMLFSAKGGLATPSRMTMLHLAGGGNVRGPGTKTSDSIPAMLSDGEYVVNADATRKNRSVLEAINSGKTPRLGTANIAGQNSVMSRTSVVNTFSPTIPITVQASGNKETDAAMTDRLTAEMDTLMSNKMAEFASKEQRSGGMLNKKRFV